MARPDVLPLGPAGGTAGRQEPVHGSSPFVSCEVHVPESGQHRSVVRNGLQFDADGSAGGKPEARFCNEFLDVGLPEVAAGEGDGVDNASLGLKLEPDGRRKTIFAQAREDADTVGISGQGADEAPRFEEPRELCLVALTEISDVQRHNRAVMERFGQGARVLKRATWLLGTFSSFAGRVGGEPGNFLVFGKGGSL